jgi:predicted nucleic acid-binding protein
VTIVIDANVLVALVIPLEYSGQASEKVDLWLTTGADLVAPLLWTYEAVSAIRKYVASGSLTHAEASAAIQALCALGIRGIEPTEELHFGALRWAERLGDFVAYDPAYLAVAEQLGADFWTADGKLLTKFRDRGLPMSWIHHISEPAALTLVP